MSIAPDNTTPLKPVVPTEMMRLPLGAVSPLWGLFAGAAVSGAAWWWMTRWTRPENLEALFAAPAKAAETVVEAVEAEAAALPERAEEAEAVIEAAGEQAEAVVEAAPEAPEALVEAVAETPEPIVEAAAEMSEAVVETVAETAELVVAEAAPVMDAASPEPEPATIEEPAAEAPVKASAAQAKRNSARRAKADA